MVSIPDTNAFGIVMAADDSYVGFLERAVRSIRAHSPAVPIEVSTCGPAPRIAALARPLNIVVRPVALPARLHRSAVSERTMTIWSRVAKLTAIASTPFASTVYLDADTVVRDDVRRLARLLPVAPDSVDIYMRWRRPEHPIRLLDWRQFYFTSPHTLDVDGMCRLIDKALGVTSSVEWAERLRPWNGGVVYGARSGMRAFGAKWLGLFLKCFTGPYADLFVPRDQLTAWLLFEEPAPKVSINELPSAWNYLASNELSEAQVGDHALLRARLMHTKIAHLTFRKDDPRFGPVIDALSSYATR